MLTLLGIRILPLNENLLVVYNNHHSYYVAADFYPVVKHAFSKDFFSSKHIYI